MKRSLKQKVSRERVGMELKASIKNQDEHLDCNILVQYLDYLYDNDIWELVFGLPEKVEIRDQKVYELDW